jgi:thymidylate kinase
VSIDYLRELDEKYKVLAEMIPQCTTYIIDANRTELEIHQEISAILVENELFVPDSFRKEM